MKKYIYSICVKFGYVNYDYDCKGNVLTYFLDKKQAISFVKKLKEFEKNIKRSHLNGPNIYSYEKILIEESFENIKRYIK